VVIPRNLPVVPMRSLPASGGGQLSTSNNLFDGAPPRCASSPNLLKTSKMTSLGKQTMSQTYPNDSQDCTVVVVDDDDAAREALSFFLQAQGFRVRSYFNPKEVLEETELPPQTCIVSDYNMPEMNGLDFLAELRKRSSAIRAILVTGDTSPAVCNRADDDDVPVIEKFCLDELPGCIRKVMKSAIN